MHYSVAVQGSCPGKGDDDMLVRRMHRSADGLVSVMGAPPPGDGDAADDKDEEDEDESDERERDPDVTWQKEPRTRSVVQQPTPDGLAVPFGEEED